MFMFHIKIIPEVESIFLEKNVLPSIHAVQQGVKTNKSELEIINIQINLC